MPFETLIDAAALRNSMAGAPAPAALIIVDCRFDLADPAAGLAAYRDGHIPGARYADLNRNLSSPVTSATGRHPLPRPEDLAARLRGWGVGHESQVIAYDATNGSIAARLWWLLRWVGHRSVAVLDGGIQAWAAAGGALQSGAPPPQVSGTAFVPRPGAQPTISTGQLAGQLHAPHYLILDARAPERFRGAVEPIDSVAGHVPGAQNEPFSSNLNPDGTFLPAGELRRRWRERLGSRDAAEVVAMCGSGVTACHNLLSLEIAGLPGAALYPGSWSEWIRDPGRPVARDSAP